MPQNAYKFDTIVGPDGDVLLKVPLLPGTPVEVVVLAAKNDAFADLIEAASSSLDFWDNSQDDADWNNA